MAALRPVLTYTSFGLLMGAFAVAYPLRSLMLGHEPWLIGMAVALGAVAQFVSRFGAITLLRLFGTKIAMVSASVMMTASVALILHESLFALLGAQVLQGVARGAFWSAAQVWALAQAIGPLKGSRDLNTGAGVGGILGPSVVGVGLSGDLRLGVVWGVLFGLLTLVLSLTIPTSRAASTPSGDARLRGSWIGPFSSAGVLAGGFAGVWKGVMDSHIPVLLTYGGSPASVVGLLVSLSNGALVAGGFLCALDNQRPTRYGLQLGYLGSGLGLATVALGAQNQMLAAIGLLICGAGVGVLQTFAPVLAVHSVGPGEHVGALALMGTARSFGIIASPVFIGGLAVGTGSVCVGILAIAAVHAVPALQAGRLPWTTS